MNRIAWIIAATIAMVVSANDAQAEMELGLKAGSLGIGLEGTYRISDRWGIRGGFNQYGYDFEDDIDGVEFDGDLDLSSIALLGDFRPTGGSFRFTGGAVINNNEIGAVADPDQTYEIGDTVYTLAEVGTLSADAGFDSLSPYLGIGFDWDVGDSFAMSFDLGALAQGTPDVQINSTGGTLSNDPDLLADLAREAELGEEDLEDLEWYPVLSLGFYYRF